PLLGTLATAAALVAVAVLLYAGARREGAIAAAGAGALVVTSGYLWAGQGAGPVVALALLLGAAALAGDAGGSGRRELVAGLVAGLAVACRPDAALGAALLVALLWSERRRIPWHLVLGLAAAVALAALALWGAFGTVVPATLLAKRQMAALA